MEEYKSNSFKAKQEQEQSSLTAKLDSKQPTEEKKKVKKVVEGKVEVKKPNEFTEFIREFIVEDIRDVAKKTIKNFLIPSLKDTILKTVSNGLSMLFGVTPTGASSTNVGKVSYNQYSQKPAAPSENSDKSRGAYNLSDVIIQNRWEAEEVIKQFKEMMSRYQVVSVSDVYEMVGVEVPYTMNRYGWTFVPANLEPVPVNGGFVIRLPRPTII